MRSIQLNTGNIIFVHDVDMISNHIINNGTYYELDFLTFILNTYK